MENENKDKKVILIDEELKEVSGGAFMMKTACKNKNQKDCESIKLCAWVGNKCILKI